MLLLLIFMIKTLLSFWLKRSVCLNIISIQQLVILRYSSGNTSTTSTTTRYCERLRRTAGGTTSPTRDYEVLQVVLRDYYERYYESLRGATSSTSRYYQVLRVILRVTPWYYEKFKVQRVVF